ncbi:EamA family transporter [Nanoarchaeota archaeon]
MKGKTSLSAIIFMVFAAIFASGGQIFYKFAANRTADFATLVLNPFLVLGLASYGIGLLFMLKALRRGELTVVYPILATSFIWVSLASPLIFKTDFMTPLKWIGVLIILAGVTLVSKGREK